MSVIHEGVRELEKVLDALPEEHRGGLRRWMVDYIRECEINWKLDRSMVVLNSEVGPGQVIAATNAQALEALSEEVAASAFVRCTRKEESGAFFAASVTVISHKRPERIVKPVSKVRL